MQDSEDGTEGLGAAELAAADEFEDGGLVRGPCAGCQKESVGQLKVGEDGVEEDEVRRNAMGRLAGDNSSDLGDVSAGDGEKKCTNPDLDACTEVKTD